MPGACKGLSLWSRAGQSQIPLWQLTAAAHCCRLSRWLAATWPLSFVSSSTPFSLGNISNPGSWAGNLEASAPLGFCLGCRNKTVCRGSLCSRLYKATSQTCFLSLAREKISWKTSSQFYLECLRLSWDWGAHNSSCRGSRSGRISIKPQSTNID